MSKYKKNKARKYKRSNLREKCEDCAYFGKKGYKDIETITFCFKNNETVESTATPCDKYSYKYLERTFPSGLRRRNRGRKRGKMK